MKKLLLLSLLFFNCSAKKTVLEYRDRFLHDTIIVNRTETLIDRFTDTLLVNMPCDSLGNLKAFNRSIFIPQGNIKLIGSNNVITAELDLNGYKKIWENQYKSSFKETSFKKQEILVKYKVPFWVWVYVVISVLFIFLLMKIKF